MIGRPTPSPLRFTVRGFGLLYRGNIGIMEKKTETTTIMGL